MKINNLYSKPVIKTLFFIFVGLGLMNVLIIFTNMHPFSDLNHISLAVVFFILAGILMSRNLFLKYDSSDEVVEIERSGLFTTRIESHSNQVGYVKYRIKDYKLTSKWYGAQLTLSYETSAGVVTKNTFPIFFFGNDQVMSLRTDLDKIVHMAAQRQTIFHNDPVLS